MLRNGHGSAGVAYEEILSCTPNTKHCGGDGGCSGATAELAFQYVKDMVFRVLGVDGLGLIPDSTYL